jgi:hypothetical protein
MNINNADDGSRRTTPPLLAATLQFNTAGAILNHRADGSLLALVVGEFSYTEICRFAWSARYRSCAIAFISATSSNKNVRLARLEGSIFLPLSEVHAR